MSKLDRYIKDKNTGDKVKMHNTSVNIREDQEKFLKRHNLNLSEITRDSIDALMREVKEEVKLL